MGIVTIFTKGGVLVYLILICSVLSLGSFIERLLKLQSIRINTPDFLMQIDILIKKGKIKDAIALCDTYHTPVARIMRTGLLHHGSSREQMTTILEEAALAEFPALESKLVLLSTIGHITPLLGLLGTVNGMIKAFQVIQEKSLTTGVASPGDLAQGIWMALITTGLGLSVAIPTIVAYNYISHQIQKVKNDMEKAATKAMTLAS